MKKQTIQIVEAPKYSNAVGGKSYKAYKETDGTWRVASARFGLFIDSRDVSEVK